jgi:murein DD-endopeptidase MepM/ murein hydrolase activator NlpD
VALLAQPPLDVTVAARAMQPGEVVRIQVMCDCAAAPHAKALGVEIPLALEGSQWVGWLGIDLEVAPGSYPLIISVPSMTQKEARTLQLDVKPKTFRTRELRVSAAFVTPPSTVEARITREAATLQRLMNGRTARAWEGPFMSPVPVKPSENFGMRSIFNGQPRQPHGGTDFSSPTGTPIRAPSAGRVVLADDLYFTGNTVVLDHGLGLFSLMAHLSKFSVTKGQSVGRGDTLGLVGATGRATGPHLHWAVRLNGARVDPLSLLAMTAPQQ